jgi:hypothetical protein
MSRHSPVLPAIAAVSAELTDGGESESNRPTIEIRAVVVTTHAFCIPGSTIEADTAHAALSRPPFTAERAADVRMAADRRRTEHDDGTRRRCP